MEQFLNPAGETVARKEKMSKGMPADYVLYVTACNEKITATGDKSSVALPEHIWRTTLLKK